MARKLFAALVLFPLGVIFVVFAVANRQAVTVSFDPFNSTQPAFAATMPLFVLILALIMLGILVGGIAAWLRQAKWRRTARRLQGEMQALRADLDLARREQALAVDRRAAAMAQAGGSSDRSLDRPLPRLQAPV